MNQVVRVIAGWIFIASVLTPVMAQETKPDSSSSETPTLHISSRLVVLDVVVTGKSGNLRNDLKKTDFQVTEDGVPQTILNFESPAAHIPPPGAAIHSTAELEAHAPDAPVTIVVLDELNTRFQDMAFARYALKKYLNAQPASLSAPTMLIAVSKGKFQVLKDYSQDKAAVLAALDHHLTDYPWQLESGVSVLRQMAESLGALEQVADATAGHPGHKNLLWVGHGFPSIDLTNPQLDSNATAGITTAVQHAVNKLRDSRITLFTIDPTAVSSQVTVKISDATPQGEINGGVGPDPFADGVQFTALAPATGGKAFYSRNDVDAEIGESARDGVNYYTLTYRPTSDSDATRPYRRIRIKVLQPELKAGYREGYYMRDDVRPVMNANRSAYDLDAAAENTLVYTGLSVVAVANPHEPGQYYVGVPQRQLQWSTEDGQETAKLTLVAVAVDNKGKILHKVTNDLTASRRTDEESATASGKLVRLAIKVTDASAAARIRFIVRSKVDGLMGTADLWMPGAHVDASSK